MSSSALRSAARAARLGAERARFELWARRLDARLRRAGGRLRLEAPHGAHFYALPDVEIHPYGGRAGTTTIRLGEHVQLGRRQILDLWAAADNTLDLGDRVTFRSGTRIQLRGGTVRIGDDSTIRDYCLLDAMDGGEIVLGERVQMGDDSAAGERVSIFDSDHRPDGSHVTNSEQPVAIAPVVIGTNTF
ncbi:MAG: hypothetical protein Q8K79_18375, partial [Solirubrobacteraceae bacterium]|nr:hypothetical protein [Solirubrobacteraceae bacterium]